jgi:hypothetical protein
VCIFSDVYVGNNIVSQFRFGFQPCLKSEKDSSVYIPCTQPFVFFQSLPRAIGMQAMPEDGMEATPAKTQRRATINAGRGTQDEG